MTNARASKAKHKADQRLIEQRDALLDVLNAILIKAGGFLVIEHEFYLGHARHPVETLPMPEGVLVRINDQAGLVGEGKQLLVVPTAKV